MARASTSARSDNINIRVTPETVSLIDRAARVFGKTRTDFIVDTVRKAAEDAVLDQHLFVLDSERWNAFLLALDGPPEPNDRLEALMARRPAWEA